MSDRYPNIDRPIYVVPGNNGLKIPVFAATSETPLTEARTWIDHFFAANPTATMTDTHTGETWTYLGRDGELHMSEMREYLPRDITHSSRRNAHHHIHEISGTPTVASPDLPTIFRIIDDPRSDLLEVAAHGETLQVARSDESPAAWLVNAVMRDVLKDLGCVPSEMGSRAVLLADYRPLTLPETELAAAQNVA